MKRSAAFRIAMGCVMKRPVTLRLEPELLERVEALARAERRPLQNTLRNLLDDGLAAQQPRSASSEQVAA
jgi:predicted transcriptional regulator